MLGVASVVLRAAGCQLRPSPDTYDGFVASFGPRVVSYWKFQNSGGDANGTQNASIVGSPQLNVATIVDLDTIEEGAPADGECIAWPGSPEIYAEVGHHARYKTAQGTIVVTFQRDTANQKSTLVAADRSVGGTSTGPGGLSIEVEASGAPRCFLRRQSGGAPVILLGQAGDVALNEAYTLIFKWGPPGLSLALWNADGALVRRLTDPLSDGVTGTSPIRFGLWHTGSSGAHDGPFGRVVWLDRRIGDEEEADLARPRTINRDVPAGDYTPFPFVTNRTPPVSHAGCAARPTFNAANPRSASFIDPMSGLEVWRVTGDLGTNVLLRGSVDTGLNFPRCLKPENNPRCPRSWNADGTLLMLPESKARDGDPASPCRIALITATGTHMNATAPWQIIRASQSYFDGIPATGWFWDPLNPLRAYAAHSDGMYEWWPAGGNGHSVGEKTKLFNWPSGFTDWDSPRGGRAQPSHDGLWYHAPVRRTSNGHWGGIRINLTTGAAGNFVTNPAFLGQGGIINEDDDRGCQSTGALGVMTCFEFQDNHPTDAKMVNMVTGAVTSPLLNEVLGHFDFTHRDGKEYAVTWRGGTWNMISQDGTITSKGSDPGLSVEHPSCRNYQDTFENYGAAGGSTSGVRYAICSVSTPTNRQGVFGVRLGATDTNQWRYICHPRTIRSENTSELHAAPSPTMNYVAFNSNWLLPGVATENNVSTYVVAIPNAWRSPNNDGS
jgi:hypothetical protein